MMRILAFSHGLWYGGAQVSFLNYLKLLRGINDVSIDVVICENANEGFVKDLSSLNINTLRVPCSLYQNLPLMDINSIGHILRNYDLYWITDIEYLISTKLKNEYNKPIIAHLHSYALICPWWALSYGLRETCLVNCRNNYIRFLSCKIMRNSVRSEIENYNYNMAKKAITIIKSPLDFITYRNFYNEQVYKAIKAIDGFIAVSAQVRDLHIIHEPLFKEKQIEVIYNPVIIPEEYIKYSLNYLSNNNDKVILYASGFQAAKGIHILLEAFKEVARYYSKARLFITRGLNDQSLIKLINKYGLNIGNEVILLGNLSRDELYKAYARSSIVAMPSIWPEPFGNVALESNYIGIPVIASDIGGLKEIIINGTTGLLVRPNDPLALAEGLIKALSISWDRQRIHEITASRFNSKRSIEKFLSFLNSFIR